MDEFVRYHVWNYPVSQSFLEIFGFEERDGYWDKIVRSQMSTDYIKIISTN